MESPNPALAVLFGLLMSGISALCWLPFTWVVYRVVTGPWKRSYARFTSWCVFVWIWLATVYATASYVGSQVDEDGSTGDLAGLIPGAMCGFGPIAALLVSIPLGMWLRRRRGWGRPVPASAAPAPYRPPSAAPGPTQVVHQHITIVNQINVQQAPQQREPQRPSRSRKIKRQRTRGEIDSKAEPRYDLDESEVKYWTEDD